MRLYRWAVLSSLVLTLISGCGGGGGGSSSNNNGGSTPTPTASATPTPQPTTLSRYVEQDVTPPTLLQPGNLLFIQSITTNGLVAGGVGPDQNRTTPVVVDINQKTFRKVEYVYNDGFSTFDRGSVLAANARGDVYGYFHVNDENVNFFQSGQTGQITLRPFPIEYTSSMSDAGTLPNPTGARLVLYTVGSDHTDTQEFALPLSGVVASGVAINGAGVVAGTISDGSGNSNITQAFVLSNGNVSILPLPEGWRYMEARAITSDGKIVGALSGDRTPQIFVSNNGATTILPPTLSVTSLFAGVFANSRGEVLALDGDHPYFWTGSAWLDLAQELRTGTTTQIRPIRLFDDGRILCITNGTNLVLLTPRQ